MELEIAGSIDTKAYCGNNFITCYGFIDRFCKTRKPFGLRAFYQKQRTKTGAGICAAVC